MAGAFRSSTSRQPTKLSGTITCEAFKDGILFYELEDDRGLYLEFEHMGRNYQKRISDFETWLSSIQHLNPRSRPTDDFRNSLSNFAIHLGSCLDEIVQTNGRRVIDYCLYHLAKDEDEEEEEEKDTALNYIRQIHIFACNLLVRTNFMAADSDFPVIDYVKGFRT